MSKSPVFSIFQLPVHTIVPITLRAALGILFLQAASLGTPAFAQEKNVLPEGAFSGDELIVPKGTGKDGAWALTPGDYKEKGATVEVLEENGVKFARIESPQDGWVNLSIYVPMTPKPSVVRISGRIRTSGLTKTGGDVPEWASAQFQVMLLNESGELMTNTPLYRATQDSGDWVEFEKEVPLDSAVAEVQVQAGLFGYTGTFDLADVKVFTE